MRASRFPSRYSSAVFRAKAAGLQLQRAARDRRAKIRRYPQDSSTPFSFTLAVSRTPLWNETEVIEGILQCGKVQNLRAAARYLNGVCIPAGEIFSFWKHVGRATTKRGFAEGRLLREGCLMPAVGGGLCQLSNALYDVALQAGCEIIERHAHSHIVPGSAAQSGRDATVAWNYIDLRFRAEQDFQIAVSLSQSELIVQLRAKTPISNAAIIPLQLLPESRKTLDPHAHSCGFCGQTHCAFHRPELAITPHGKTAFLTDEAWPEFQDYIAQNHDKRDALFAPLDSTRWKQPRYNWSTSGFAESHFATFPALHRAWLARRLQHQSAARLQAQLQSAQRIAGFYARSLSPDVTRLVVAQSLLPFLWNEGVLGGRSFRVLMTRLPLGVLQARLDAEFARHPERQTFNEFRAPSWIVETEKQCLREADAIITPHAEIAELFAEKSALLDWKLAPAKPCLNPNARAIAFPGPTAARKGAYELRAAARELDLEILLLGSELEGADFWNGVRTRRIAPGEDWLAQCAAVAQPALIEENPRLLLRAIACRIPVIATPHCGLPESDGVLLIPFGNAAALRAALETVLFSTCFSSKN